MKPTSSPVTVTLDRRALQTAIEFLNRTDLKGHEVPAFFSVMSALQRALAQPSSAPEEAKAPSA